MFGNFDETSFNIKVDDDDKKEKTFDLESYADYMAYENKDKKKAYNRPKELSDKNNDILKIVRYDTNKHKIKQRPMMEKNIIPTHASAVVFCGRSGSGKSNLLVNLAERPEFYGKTDKKNPGLAITT
jgi:DNA replication protein DnaC